MDSSAMSWLNETEFDDSVFNDEFDFLDSFDEEVIAVIRQDFESCLATAENENNIIQISSSNANSNNINNSPPQPASGIQNPNDFSNFPTIPGPDHNNRASSNTPIILNFENNAGSPENPRQVNYSSSRALSLNPDEEGGVCEEQYFEGATKKKRARPPSQTYDHIIAERKRREQLSQRFVLLSTIVPGLKKMDKTSVLGDAIKYLKHLQERVKTLEEEARKQTMESVVFVKKSQMVVEDEGSSSDEKSGSSSDELPLPEIEARVCNNRLLVRVQCEKQKGLLANLLCKIEKLNLVVVNTNVATFGRFVLDISIIAEMEKEFNLTVKDVVKRLRAALHSSNKS